MLTSNPKKYTFKSSLIFKIIMFKKLFSSAIAFYFFCSMPLALGAEKILGRWSDGWYVGTVVEKSSDRAKIFFDDGDQAIVPLSGIRPLDWTAGTRLQCNWKGAGAYYWAMILARNGEKISVRYDDKVEETTVIGRCRVPLNNASAPSQQQGRNDKGNNQNTTPGCVDPFADTGRDAGNCDPEVQRLYEALLNGIDPMTGKPICPNDREFKDARKICAPAADYSKCMQRVLDFDYRKCEESK
jgi:hypothetical protein